MGMAAVNNVAAVSLNIGYPTAVSAPHSMANALKKLIAVAAATDITFPAAEKTKAYLADPSAFAVAAPVVKRRRKKLLLLLKNHPTLTVAVRDLIFLVRKKN